MKNDINKYTKFICVDGENRPMSFEDNQLCYNTSSHWEDKHFPIKIYSKRKALQFIDKSIAYRTKMKFSIVVYRIMPVK